MSFVLNLAGIPIEVHHQYEHIATLCEAYRTEEQPAFAVAVTGEQISAEMALNGGRFPCGLCESTCIHREIVKGLVKHGVILMHSAVIAVDGIAYAFMAKSGVGKSTHMRLWQQTFGDRAVVVNGDKPLFSFQGGVLMAHGSPWQGKEGLGANISMPVGGIALLERAEVNAIRPASSAEVVGRIFHQVLVPDNAVDVSAFMGLLDRIVKTVPFYTLKCNMEREAALVAWEGMAQVRK